MHLPKKPYNKQGHTNMLRRHTTVSIWLHQKFTVSIIREDFYILEASSPPILSNEELSRMCMMQVPNLALHSELFLCTRCHVTEFTVLHYSPDYLPLYLTGF